MKKFRGLLGSLVWLVSGLLGWSAAAAPVDLLTAGEIAGRALGVQNRVERRGLERRGITVFQERTLTAGQELTDPETDETLAYVFPLDPRGYVVISPDTDISPVIAYSFGGDFPWEAPSPNPLLDLVTWDMENRLEALPLISDKLRAENNRLWINYLTGETSFLEKLGAATVYGEYLKTAWHQEDPYNKYCPWDSVNNRRCIVGCVATAMAQVINYHQYPSSVTFTAAESYQNHSPEVWIDAPGAIISSISYPAGDDMAARISYACGVSVYMDYGWDGSFSNVMWAAEALTGKWRYNSAQHYDNYLGGIDQYLRNNMINGKPALLGVSKSGLAKHAIVCDGYNSTSGQYHLNYGWGGYCNGWYTLPTGMPEGYNVVVDGLINIIPGSGPVPTPIPQPADYRVLAGGDYNGNGKSDIAVFRASRGLWAIRGMTRVYFGKSGDVPVPGDYYGDGKTEICIFRPSSGLWSFREAGGAVGRSYFGKNGDIPVPKDHNHDGKTDIAIFRPSSGLWAIKNFGRYYFGQSGDVPLGFPSAIAVFRPSTGLWAVRNGWRAYFGKSGDIPVPGRHTVSTGWAPGIFRPSTGMWALWSVTRVYFGGSSDQPVPADYNGNGTDDIGVFRNASGLWALRKISRVYFGTAGDIPVTR